jgi:hypothetical protein
MFCENAVHIRRSEDRFERYMMKVIEADDWNHLREIFDENFSDTLGHVFRGHGDMSWNLESTLARLCKKVEGNLPAQKIELLQLRNFRLKIRGLRGRNPSQLSDDELWSLGQHYGLCTPLLDWSYSPYLAAYFAFESAGACTNGKRSIFAIDKVEVERKVGSLLADFKFLEPLQDDNNRIVAQAGLFTKIPIGVNLEAWLEQNNLQDCLQKINIEDDYRLEALNDLKLMNISGSTVYPDLHGASISCNMLVETLSENVEAKKKILEMMRQLNV